MNDRNDWPGAKRRATAHFHGRPPQAVFKASQPLRRQHSALRSPVTWSTGQRLRPRFRGHATQICKNWGIEIMLRTLTVGAIACVFHFPVLAQDSAERPLLMPGKRTLYQRALANPGSRLYAKPSLNAAAQPVIPFTVFYAYGRKALNDSKWVRVGSDSHGGVRGWIQEDSLIPWHQALTVTFKASEDIDRVLLFRDRKSLKRLVEKQDLKTYARLYQEAVLGTLSPDSPVIAIQPEANIDIEDDFYLVPIKRHEDTYLGTERARLLQVASVPLQSAAPAAAPLQNAPGNKAPSYRSGIVFVIDSTQSMRPYIERTREVMRKVYDTIDAAGLSHQVSFGLTSFRDFVRGAPEGQFLVRNFVSLKEGGESQRFFSQVQTLDAATTSNVDFTEDAFAGIKSAIESNPWEDFDARNIVLVTDAATREANDALSSTRLGVDEMRQLAQDRGIAIWVLHLRTPRGGAKDHRQAEQQYRRLSEYPGIGDLYYGVGMGKAEDFGRVLQTLADQLAEQVGKVAKGDAALPPGARVRVKGIWSRSRKRSRSSDTPCRCVTCERCKGSIPRRCSMPGWSIVIFKTPSAPRLRCACS